MPEFTRELERRNPVLTRTAWIHAGLAVLALALMPVDDRTLLGVSVWLKPFKFMVSLAVFLGTLAWLLEHLRGADRFVRVVSWGVSVTMLIETAALWTQAARGRPSHYNVTTPFDGVVFGVMGVMILLTSLLVAAATIAFFVRRLDLPRTYLWGIRLGLVVFLLGSAQGLMMISNRAHTVGAPDGGPGLPLVGWSTDAGDLRIAHALGLHALQILPLAGYVISRALASRSAALRLGLLGAFTLLYVGLMTGALAQALAGLPLLG